MPDNFNTIEGTEVLNLNDGVQGSHAVTVDDLKEYSNIGVLGELVFEAYIRQNGGDDPLAQTSGSLVVGTTYRIISYVPGDDFTNVGASSNADNVFFIATGTTPAVWTNSSNISYNNGAPTVYYIVKNTLDVWGFLYNGNGDNLIKSNNSFITDKTFLTTGVVSDNSSLDPATVSWRINSTDEIRILTYMGGSATVATFNSYIKIIVLP